MASPILEVKDLHTFFRTREGVVKAVNGVSLTLEEDTILGVVGESGAGKTVTALSILQLVPFPGQIVSGSIRYNGKELLGLSAEQMRPLRGKEISLIFQDAAAALNPVIPIGKQVEEIIREHTRMGHRQVRAMSVDLLTQMGIPDASRMMDRYPFQLSGGMAQRVMLAIGVAMKPRVLIADEPTSNLDVTLQAEILQRLRQMRHENHSSIMLITHDLGVIAQMADNVAVMYGGMIVEYAETRALFARPAHPYTWGLFQALPRLDSTARALTPMRGAPPKMVDPPDQCPFLHRCPKATNQCRTEPRPKLQQVGAGHQVACYNQISYAEASEAR
ncbi:MAG: ABC transporter ATP-binding protein [Chloroflexi bacterium]|nr:ABC transporter ATP-binding protein [Chloroflexota bacterium]